MTKLALAAAVVIAAALGLYVGNPFSSSITWANMRDAFLAQQWVHVKYDNGRETWSNLQTGDHCLKDWDGRCVAIDRTRNIRQTYDAALGQHISENRPARYPNDIVPPWEPKTAWESVIGPWEAMAEYGRTQDWEVERHSDSTGGRQLVRFDCYFNDAAGRRLLIRHLWADPTTRLPLTIWERLQLGDRERQKRESVTGAFDFPQTGPASIYDLGVSRDLPVAKSHDKIASASVTEVLEAGKAALKRFPPRYRVVVWDNERETEIEVIWRDDQRIRHDHYFNIRANSYPEYHLALPATAEEAFVWAKTQTPISTYLFDGEKVYTRHYQHPAVTKSAAEARVEKSEDGFGLPMNSRPIEEQWFYAKLRPADFEVIADAPEELSPYIGLRTNHGDIRREYYVDPEHDYLCVRNIWWKQRSGRWEKEREYEYSSFTRLPGGSWYAAKCSLVTYPDPERGTVRGGANWNLDIQLLEESDFPSGTFEGEDLLEGAKLETY